MNQTTVDEVLCTKCGACMAVCPAGIVRPHKRTGLPTLRKALESMCIQCGHCVAVCPVDALTHSAATVEPDDDASGAVHHVIRRRRSIRAYRDDVPSRATIEKLLETASHSPSACNRQPVEWVVVHGRETVHELAGLVVDGARQAGTMPFVVSAWDAGQDPVLRGAPCVVVAHASAGADSLDGCSPTDCAIAVATLELAATAEGLGCCWAGFLMMSSKDPAVKRYLQIPEGRAMFGALMIGYAQYEYPRIPQRQGVRVGWIGSSASEETTAGETSS